MNPSTPRILTLCAVTSILAVTACNALPPRASTSPEPRATQQMRKPAMQKVAKRPPGPSPIGIHYISIEAGYSRGFLLTGEVPATTAGQAVATRINRERAWYPDRKIEIVEIFRVDESDGDGVIHGVWLDYQPRPKPKVAK